MPMWLRFAVFFVVLALLLAGMNVYVHRRVSRLLRLGPRGRKVLAALLVVGAAAAVGGRIAARGGAPDWAAPLGLTGNTVELGVLITAILMALADLVRSPVVLYERWRKKRAKKEG